MDYYQIIRSENEKHQRVIKEKQDAFRQTYYTQLLFVSATLAGILIGLAPDQKDLSPVGIYSILVAQVGLVLCSLLLVISLNLQLSAYHKFGNKVTEHFERRLTDQSYDERNVYMYPPSSLYLIEFLVSCLFIIAMLSLVVFCISVAWPTVSKLGIMN